MKTIAVYIIFILLSMGAYAQCDNSLLEKAGAKCGNDAIFLREFKVKLAEGTISTPSPVAKYSLLLNKDIHYRFAVSNDTSQYGTAIMQLFDNQEMLASSFDVGSKTDNELFDITIPKTKSYTLVISFNESYEGCAAVALAMIPDTSKRNNFDIISRHDNILYANIPNKVHFQSEEYAKGNMQISIDNGTIEQIDDYYLIKPSVADFINITIVNYSNKDSVRKTIAMKVEPVPLPSVKLNGKPGGLIKKAALLHSYGLKLFEKIETADTFHEVISFYISNRNGNISGIKSDGSNFTHEQKDYIETLESGETLYIYNILIRNISGEINTLFPLGFIIE